MPFPKLDLSHIFKLGAIIDVETGGFSREKNALIEVGVLLVDPTLEIVDHYHTYVSPAKGLTVDPGAAGVNGYKPELWGEFPDGYSPSEEELAAVVHPLIPSHAVADDLLTWLNGRQATGIAFNAPFDKGWITHYAPGFASKLAPDWICAMQAIKKVYQAQGVKVEKGMAKLGAACDTFRYEELTGEKWVRHTALDDCYAARFIMAIAGLQKVLG